MLKNIDRIFFIFFLLFSLQYQSTFSQNSSQNDSNANKSVEKKWEFDFQLDQRTSFLEAKQYSGSPIRVFGFTFGWTYQHRWRVGLGAYFIRNLDGKAYLLKHSPQIESAAPNARILGTGPNRFYLAQNSLQMYYITPSLEYIFYKSKWLDLSLPFEVGIGYSKFKLNEYFTNEPLPVINKNGRRVNAQNIFFPALIGFAAKLNLSPDVALNASVGYRKILSEIGLNQDFDGVYYQLGLQLVPTNIKNNIRKDWRAWKAKRKQ
jgi:hypothetical protein